MPLRTTTSTTSELPVYTYDAPITFSYSTSPTALDADSTSTAVTSRLLHEPDASIPEDERTYWTPFPAVLEGVLDNVFFTPRDGYRTHLKEMLSQDIQSVRQVLATKDNGVTLYTTREIIYRCANCKEFNRQGNQHTGLHDGGDRYLCHICRIDYAICNWCGTAVRRDDITATRAGSRLACPSCVSAHSLRVCPSCGEIREFRGRREICDRCSISRGEERRGLEATCGVRSYGYKPNPVFLPSYSKGELYLGVELETDGYRDIDGAGTTLMQSPQFDTKFYMKHDSSLCEGIEIVSHPATLAYHKSEFEWQSITEIVKKFGGKSHYTSTCGLHIHFNKDFFGETTVRVDAHSVCLLYLVDKFWPKMLSFSRRDPGRTGHCRQHKAKFAEMTLSQFRTLKREFCHGTVVNVHGNGGSTIEIRLFRGTLNLNTLFATLELVDFLVRYAKVHGLSYMTRLTWSKLFKSASKEEYPYLDAYLEFKKLKTEVKETEGKEKCALSFVNEGD